MSASDPGFYPAGYADGRTARKIDVIAMVAPGFLEIRDPTGTMLERWAFADIAVVSAPRRDEPGVLKGGRDGRARLTFTHAALIARLRDAGAGAPAAHAGDRRMVRRVLVWGAAMVAGVAAIFLVAIPLLAKEIAAVIPRGFEARLGDRYVEMLTGFLADAPEANQLCRDRDGIAVIKRLVDRLQAVAQVDPPPAVTVVNGGLVNAFALPGSRLIVMRGLIDAVDDADELAAVLAHELAHAVHRHPTEAAVKRTAGSFVVGLLLGDAISVSIVGSVAGQLLAAAYTREAESEADATGLMLLDKAGIEAGGFVRFMARMAEMEGKASGARLLAHFSTHPPSEARAALGRAHAGRGAPAMSAEAWSQLKAVCRLTR